MKSLHLHCCRQPACLFSDHQTEFLNFTTKLHTYANKQAKSQKLRYIRVFHCTLTKQLSRNCSHIIATQYVADVHSVFFINTYPAQPKQKKNKQPNRHTNILRVDSRRRCMQQHVPAKSSLQEAGTQDVQQQGMNQCFYRQATTRKGGIQPPVDRYAQLK